MKKELRKKYIEQRNKIARDELHNSSKKIFDQLESSKIFRDSKVIFTYISFGSEIDTISFIKNNINKKIIVVPKLINNKMELIEIKSFNNLEKNSYGILEPKEHNFFLGEVDLVITPSVVFSKDGYRLGYGKGYYDRYFENNNYLYSVGLSLSCMLKETLPIEDHDKKVDFLITEEEIIKIKD